MGADISNMSALEAMKLNYNSIKGALRSEENTGRFFFPIVVASALIISGSMKGMSLMEIVTNTRFLIVFAVFVLVVVPLMMAIANKMNDKGYGNYIRALEQKIKEMEQV